jgi:hypothetical protein
VELPGIVPAVATVNVVPVMLTEGPDTLAANVKGFAVTVTVPAAVIDTAPGLVPPKVNAPGIVRLPALVDTLNVPDELNAKVPDKIVADVADAAILNVVVPLMVPLRVELIAFAPAVVMIT